ncbi:hypothetical protein [Nocardioides sp. MH1]|uniref:hypothetical protein n=1 Tax=Nocardioides sp. MH1 TaxID=3242490 RepID=UPI00351FA75C
MGWKDVARRASKWADDKIEAGSNEAVTSFLEKVLPPDLAEKVTENRPENVAARKAERDAQEESERRQRLAEMTAGGATAQLVLTLSGGESGTLSVTLPCERSEEHPEQEEGEEGPPPLGWYRVRLEAPDPLPVGSTSLAELSLAVPDFRGPGHYDLAVLAERGDNGDIQTWDALEMYLNPTGEADDRTWYVDVYGERPVIDVTPTSITFDLPMGSAVNNIRASGTVTW